MTKVEEGLWPRISVVLCTRDRSGSISRAVDSVLTAGYPNKEFIVVDQSESNATAGIIAAFKRGNRIQHIRSSLTGVSRARNLGLARTTGDIIAFTDDDCVVPQDWLVQIKKAFEADDEVGIVFGAVAAAPHDAAKGLIPRNEPREPRVVRNVRDKHWIGGMGACMAVRRRVFDALSGFDPELGAGAQLRAGEDTDFSLRALEHGFAIREAPSVHVIHYGFRTWLENDNVVFDYMFGTGAMFAKHVRLRQKGILILLVHVFRRWLFDTPIIKYSAAPRRVFRLSCFCRGWLKGWRLPLNHASQQFGAEDVSGQKRIQAKMPRADFTAECPSSGR